VRRAPLRRSTPLRRVPAPVRRTPLQRTTPLRPGPWRKPAGEGAAARTTRPPFGASDAQRQKIVGGACIVCLQTKGVTPAHLSATPTSPAPMTRRRSARR
jgi:hypothetical protein